MINKNSLLQTLLTGDPDSRAYRLAAQKLEQDTSLQQALEAAAAGASGKNASASMEWWTEARQVLAETGLPGDEAGGHSSIVIEVESMMDADDAIDYEPVNLDFLEPPSHPELLGKFGRYDVERVLGVGGMGVVLRAFDSELHRIVAIKVLAPHLAHSSSGRRRFAREAQAAAAVVHPHVIPIFNVDSSAKLPYLVMQYVSGLSLQRRVDYEGPLSIADVLRIAQQTAAGLAAAHAQGLVHRDVKPANILLEESVDRVLLSDFGLARAVDDASLTKTGIVAGTPFYMSPEQSLGESIDHRSDLFSLGSVIYFMLSGRPPFRAQGAMAVLHRICRSKHRSVTEVNPDVPIELSLLVDRLLAKAPAQRFQNASDVERELAQMLERLQTGRLSLGSSGWLASGSAILKTRLKLAGLVGLAVTLMLIAAIGGIIGQSYVGGGSPEPQPRTLASPNAAEHGKNSAVRGRENSAASESQPWSMVPTWSNSPMPRVDDDFSERVVQVQQELFLLESANQTRFYNLDYFEFEVQVIEQKIEALRNGL